MLLVDDESANLRMMERLFRPDYEVITAVSGTEALELLSRHDVALIISDQRMSGMTGIEFLKRAAQMRRRTVRLILTGYTDVSDLVDAVNSGVVYKYITKPWVNTDLLQTVQRSIEYYETSKNHHLLEQENERLVNRIQTTVESFVDTVLEIMAHKSSNLAEHCRRTAHYAALIGQRFNLDPAEMEKLNYASLLHEVPNIRIPFKMYFTKTALTPEQHRVTRNNYEKGLQMISSVPDFEDVAAIIFRQHEHYDGTGFFDGLEGEQIPLNSRILAVASAYDEINSGQNRALLSTKGASTDWMLKRSGIELDPRIVDMCLKIELAEPKDVPAAVSSNGHQQKAIVAV